MQHEAAILRLHQGVSSIVNTHELVNTRFQQDGGGLRPRVHRAPRQFRHHNARILNPEIGSLIQLCDETAQAQRTCLPHDEDVVRFVEE